MRGLMLATLFSMLFGTSACGETPAWNSFFKTGCSFLLDKTECTRSLKAFQTLKPDVREFISGALAELAALPLDASILVNGRTLLAGHMEQLQQAFPATDAERLSLAGPTFGPNGDVLWSLGRGVLVGKANEAAKLPALRDSGTAQYAQLHASVQTIVDAPTSGAPGVQADMNAYRFPAASTFEFSAALSSK